MHFWARFSGHGPLVMKSSAKDAGPLLRLSTWLTDQTLRNAPKNALFPSSLHCYFRCTFFGQCSSRVKCIIMHSRYTVIGLQTCGVLNFYTPYYIANTLKLFNCTTCVQHRYRVTYTTLLLLLIIKNSLFYLLQLKLHPHIYAY